MKSNSKIKLANLTIKLMAFTVLVIILWFLIFIVSTTFNLNVFASKTTDFFMMIISAAIAIIICSAFLNISLNISLIADSKIREMKLEPAIKFGKKMFITFGLIFILIVSFLFIGDYLSRNKEKHLLYNECEDIVQRYDKSINEITECLADENKLKEIPSILQFLSNQKAEFPDVQIITSVDFNGQIAYLTITGYANAEDLGKPFFNNSFYQCNLKDCDYLKSVFEDDLDKIHFWSEESDYRLYYPVKTNKAHFVLLFSKYTRYGKFGS